MILVGGRLWVCNENGNYLSELNVTNGALIRTVGSRADQFSDPSDIATNGRFLWVTNNTGSSITQLNATDGSLVRVIRPARIRFNYPSAISYEGGHLWVASGGNANHTSQVDELSAASGAIVRVVKQDIWAPEAIDAIGSNVWVGNLVDDQINVTGNPNHSVTELSATTGAVERSINLTHDGAGVQAAAFAPNGGNVWMSNSIVSTPGTNYQAVELRASDGGIVQQAGGTHPWSTSGGGSPGGISLVGNHLWISDWNNVVELNATTGKVMRIVGARRDRIDVTQDVLAYGNYVWVSNSGGNSLTELQASTGGLVRFVP
jgi:hypothetical protein